MPNLHASDTFDVFCPLGSDCRFNIALVEETFSLDLRINGVKARGCRIIDLLRFGFHV